MDDTRERGLLAWQWSTYHDRHRDRRNLMIHAFTNPLFLAGTCALVAPVLGGPGWATLAGLAAMVAASALQGSGHRREAMPPAPLLGGFDVVARQFVEQWVNFPRFVLSGGFARAFRGTEGRP